MTGFARLLRCTAWLVLIALMAACVPAPVQPAPVVTASETVTMYVGPELADCTGVAAQACLQVRGQPNEAYQLFYSPIAGFEYEPGYEYEITVKVEPVANPPADAPAYAYTLVEVVSKTPATTATLPEATPTLPTPTEHEPAAEPAAGSLDGSAWTLISYIDAQGQAATVLPDAPATLEFSGGQIGGNASCNRYGGTYTQDGDKLTIEPGAMTLMACDEPIMAQEVAFLAALGQAASVRVTGDKLDILNAEGAVILTFTTRVSVPLTDTEWQVTGYNNGRGGVVSILAGTTITLTFTTDGEAGGLAGCNSYGGEYKLDGNNLAISRVFSTMKVCNEPEGVMDQEAAYLAALNAVATYSISGDTLTLSTADGATVLSATALNAPAAIEIQESAAEATTVPTAEPTAVPTDEPTVEPTAVEPVAATATAPAAAEPAPAATALPPAAADTAFVGPVWQWQETAQADGSVVTVKSPERYTVQFMEDGIVVVRADCNRASGVYTVAGDALTIKVGAMTRAACPSGSLYMQFIESLNNAATFAFAADNLVIGQAAGAGDMRFAAQ